MACSRILGSTQVVACAARYLSLQSVARCSNSSFADFNSQSQSVKLKSSFGGTGLKLALPKCGVKASAGIHKQGVQIVRCVQTQQTPTAAPPPPQQQKPYFATKYIDNFDLPHGAQKLCVYEINDLDRGSPKLLVNSNNTNAAGKRVKGLGDLLPYTNKLYDGTLKERLGITAGMCIMIEYIPEFDGDRYECQFSAYFGEYGHISVQGPYTSYCDCMMTVTGGSGIFTGARGVAKCKTLLPTKLFYEFHLLDIHKLPAKLTQTPVAPTPDITVRYQKN